MTTTIATTEVKPCAFYRWITEDDEGVDARICEFLVWHYLDGALDGAYAGCDALNRTVFVARRGGEYGEKWVIHEGQDLHAAMEGAQRLLGFSFDRMDEMEILADATVGAAQGDEACRRWLTHYGYERLLP